MNYTDNQINQQTIRLERLKRTAVSAVHNALADILAEAEPNERRAILDAVRDNLKRC